MLYTLFRVLVSCELAIVLYTTLEPRGLTGYLSRRKRGNAQATALGKRRLGLRSSAGCQLTITFVGVYLRMGLTERRLTSGVEGAFCFARRSFHQHDFE